MWATWKGRWTEEGKSLFSYTKELELLELERKAYLLMFLERKGGTLDSKQKEDKALTLFQAGVRIELSTVVTVFNSTPPCGCSHKRSNHITN